MLLYKFTVVTELRRRLNQAFLSSSYPCGEWDNEFKMNSDSLPYYLTFDFKHSVQYHVIKPFLVIKV